MKTNTFKLQFFIFFISWNDIFVWQTMIEREKNPNHQNVQFMAKNKLKTT